AHRTTAARGLALVNSARPRSSRSVLEWGYGAVRVLFEPRLPVREKLSARLRILVARRVRRLVLAAIGGPSWAHRMPARRLPLPSLARIGTRVPAWRCQRISGSQNTVP